MTDLGPLAERLRKVEDHTQTIDRDALVKFGEGLDGRVLEKVIVALEARLTEHVGASGPALGRDRRPSRAGSEGRGHAHDRANQRRRKSHPTDRNPGARLCRGRAAIQLRADCRSRSEALRAAGSPAGQVPRNHRGRAAIHGGARRAGNDGAGKPRVIARCRSRAPRRNSRRICAAMVRLSGRLSAEMHGLAERQQSQTAPLQQALQQLETKLTTLREELPPKIRQIVEAVEASMDARISAGDQQAAGQWPGWNRRWPRCARRCPARAASGRRSTRVCGSHAEQVGALDQKLTVLQEELPPKIKAIVDAVRESLDARMAVELQASRNSTARRSGRPRRASAKAGAVPRTVAAASKTPELAAGLAKLQADLALGCALRRRARTACRPSHRRHGRGIGSVARAAQRPDRATGSTLASGAGGNLCRLKSNRPSPGCGNRSRSSSPRKSTNWKPARQTAPPIWTGPCNTHRCWSRACWRSNRNCSVTRTRRSSGPSSASGKRSRDDCRSARRRPPRKLSRACAKFRPAPSRTCST